MTKQFVKRLYEQATDTSEYLAELSPDQVIKEFRSIIDDCAVVFAVFPDDVEPDALCIKCVKGFGHIGVGNTAALLLDSKSSVEIMQSEIEALAGPPPTRAYLISGTATLH